MDETHSWTDEDDFVTVYLYRFGTDRLPFDISTVVARRGIKLGSMDMRIRNLKAYEGTGNLDHIAKRTVRVFEQHKNTPEPELRSLAFPDLAG